METTNETLKIYFGKTGVTISLVVTIANAFLLAISLLGIEFKYETLESLCFFSLIFEFIYGVILSFKILKNKEKYRHLIPFLFLNWFIGCFCTNIFINIFENLPVWAYMVTLLFCISNFSFTANTKTKS